MSDDIEVDITIPDDDEIDSDNDGVADSFEAGVASEKADNAEELAEEAEFKADTAIDLAMVSNEQSYATREQLEIQQGIIAAQSTRIEEMMTTIAGLVDITTNLANVALADKESSEFEELPPDEEPPNRHWLMRPIFGGK